MLQAAVLRRLCLGRSSASAERLRLAYMRTVRQATTAASAGAGDRWRTVSRGAPAGGRAGRGEPRESSSGVCPSRCNA